LFLGPLPAREAITAPRRPRFYVLRAAYPLALFLLICTAWLVLAGTQRIESVGQMARFGSILFPFLATIQLALLTFVAALTTAGSIAQEKDRNTLLLLLMTRLNNCELVLGKTLASLLQTLTMLAAALPIFMLTVLLGGISFPQVAAVYAVTLATVLAAGALGSAVALWRHNTFQILAATVMLIVAWLALAEAVAALGLPFAGRSSDEWAVTLSPIRAVISACRPQPGGGRIAGIAADPLSCAAFALSLGAAITAVACWRVRKWNPSQQARPVTPQQPGEARAETATPNAASDDSARDAHVDARTTPPERIKTRPVWDQPVLWREVRTAAYGRKLIVIRLAYLVMVALAAWSLHAKVASGEALAVRQGSSAVLPAAAGPLAPLILLSLVLINALAVTSITSERDGRSLDMLLATDVTPGEFLLGKLGGVAWVCKEMVLAPLLLCGYLWWVGGVSLENSIYLALGLLVLEAFAAMLGIHCGMNYSNSRSATLVSLGVVFFLFLGVSACIVMMISFSGAFQVQLAPFLAFIMGGGVGLYAAIGARNPSRAIVLSAIVLPLATFYGITSYLLGHMLSVFLVVVFSYSLASLAMLMPAVAEFDFAMGRTREAEG